MCQEVFMFSFFPAKLKKKNTKTPVSVGCPVEFRSQAVFHLSVHLQSPPFSLLSMNENLILFSSAYSHCRLL